MPRTPRRRPRRDMRCMRWRSRSGIRSRALPFASRRQFRTTSGKRWRGNPTSQACCSDQPASIAQSSPFAHAAQGRNRITLRRQFLLRYRFSLGSRRADVMISDRRFAREGVCPGKGVPDTFPDRHDGRTTTCRQQNSRWIAATITDGHSANDGAQPRNPNSQARSDGKPPAARSSGVGKSIQRPASATIPSRRSRS